MQGVVTIFICKKGHIIATEACFDDACFGGFSKQDSQRIRSKNRIVSKVVKAYCSPNLTENISEYTYERIFDDLINNGAKLHHEYVGYKDTQERKD